MFQYRRIKDSYKRVFFSPSVVDFNQAGVEYQGLQVKSDYIQNYSIGLNLEFL
jgi:hypothetical protein